MHCRWKDGASFQPAPGLVGRSPTPRTLSLVAAPPCASPCVGGSCLMSPGASPPAGGSVRCARGGSSASLKTSSFVATPAPGSAASVAALAAAGAAAAANAAAMAAAAVSVGHTPLQQQATPAQQCHAGPPIQPPQFQHLPKQLEQAQAQLAQPKLSPQQQVQAQPQQAQAQAQLQQAQPQQGQAHLQQAQLQHAQPQQQQQQLQLVPPLLLPAQQAVPMSAVLMAHEGVDVAPWVSAARTFAVSSDFDIRAGLQDRPPLKLPIIMATMKRESAGKRTIQALADKLALHQLLSNLDVPQVPILFQTQGGVRREDVAVFVDTHLSSPGCSDVVLKPSHLSNGAGVIVVSEVTAQTRDQTISYLVSHMEQFLAQHAAPHESLALQSLRTGFVAQPRYESVIGFKMPLELRVISLWGKVRLALWWWGRGAGAPGESPQRNVWVIRRPSKPGQLSDDDSWEVLHEHQGSNPGFDRAIELFMRHIHAMAATTEAVATAVGAPFLRADFFVGSVKFGVRLNEVAYGCGVEYRTKSGLMGCGTGVADDASNIARILQDGFRVCGPAVPAKEFLSKLGAHGRTYAELSILPIPRWSLPRMPSTALLASADEEAQGFAVTEDLCQTRRDLNECMLRRWTMDAVGVLSPLVAGGAVSPTGGGGGPLVAISPPAPHQQLQPQLLQQSPQKQRQAKKHQHVPGAHAMWAPPRSVLMPRMLQNVVLVSPPKHGQLNC